MDEQTIFTMAIEKKSPAERDKFLDQACAGNAELRGSVDLLLKAYEKAGVFLEDAPSVIAATIGQPAIVEQPGAMIGPYKLREELGEGGMGAVFMATQKEPIRRRVAIKVIKPGMDSKQVVNRFEAERQALAMMDHPNIARVIDGGTTVSGRPYFVMELVKGMPITGYCDRYRLTTDDRLALFSDVCSAVQHAHQKGIIHRDLKPSNILVTLLDGKAIPKVIDFGIAKAVSGRLTDASFVTGHAQMVGTPLYMSPEQADLSAVDVDTRSDVYSLGVLLYELLTGTTPFDGERMSSASFDEFRRIVREEDPPRPSVRLSTLDAALETVADKHQTDPRTLSHEVSGELDWIVMKSLDKDRTRRYESATDLAKDVDRHLNDEPVEACPPSKVYRFGKFARRHRTTLVTATAVLLSTLIALVAITLAALSRGEAADRQRELADQRVQVQRGINDALTEVARLRGQTDQDGESALTKAREQAQRALALAEAGPTEPTLVAQVQQLSEELDQERRERDLLTSLDKAWLAQVNMVDRCFNEQASIPFMHEALQAYGVDLREMATEECAAVIRASSPTAQREILAALNEWYVMVKPLRGINVRRVAGQVFVKSLMPESSVARDRRLQPGDQLVGVGAGPNLPIADTSGMDASEVEDLLGSAFGATARLQVFPEGESEPRIYVISRDPVSDRLKAVLEAADQDNWRHRFREAAKMVESAKRRVKLEELAVDADIAKQPARILVRLAKALRGASSLEIAMSLLHDVWQKRPDDVTVNLNLAIMLKGHGRPPRLEDAVRYYTAAVALRPDSYGLRNNLGVALADHGKSEEAIAQYREVLRINPDLALARSNLARQLLFQGKLDEASAECQTALRIDPDSASAHRTLGRVFGAQARFGEAIAEYREALRIDPDSLEAHNDLAMVFADQGRLKEAMIEYREALRIDPEDARIHHNMGLDLSESGQVAEAAAALRQALNFDPNNAEIRIDLGLALERNGAIEEAIAEYREAIRIDRDNARAHLNLGTTFFDLGKFDEARDEFQCVLRIQPDHADGHHNLGQVYLRQGRPEEAASAFREAVRLEPEHTSAHTGLGLGLSQRGMLEEAITAFRAAVRVDPNDVASHCNLGTALHIKGRWDEAIAEFAEVVRLRPDSAIGHFNSANAYGAKGRISEAITEYREAIRIQPDHVQAHNSLAWLLATSPKRQLRQPEQAVTHATKAVDLSPDFGAFRNTLGVALYRNGQWKDAIEALTKSTELTGGGGTCDWLFLAMSHWQLDQREDARRWYDKAAQWMNEDKCDNKELLRFRAEAAELLGIEESHAEKKGPGSKTDSEETVSEKPLMEKDEAS